MRLSRTAVRAGWVFDSAPDVEPAFPSPHRPSMAEESERLAGLWKQGRPLPPSQRSSLRWQLLDLGFLQLAAHDPRRPLALVRNVMNAVPLVQSLRFIDEELPPRQLATVFGSVLPAVLGKP
jgi:lycopene beta-cyclase